MKQRSRFYPRVHVDTSDSAAVGQAGGVLLTEAVRASGLDTALSASLAPWRKPLAVHDPAKVVLDLALSLAVGGDCLADVAVLRAEPGVFGAVASDPTVSRTIDVLAGDAPAALAAIDAARAQARATVWALAGQHAPDHGADASAPLIVDLDATLVGAHSDKEQAAATFKRGYGFHPLCAFVDHGAEGTGEPLTVMLRPGNAGSNTAADHITV
ncbi:MAG TPA: transposase, partial [Dermatophilaceae bacterium]|nr:transposase [Dermatophilaceae bacterium]